MALCDETIGKNPGIARVHINILGDEFEETEILEPGKGIVCYADQEGGISYLKVNHAAFSGDDFSDSVILFRAHIDPLNGALIVEEHFLEETGLSTQPIQIDQNTAKGQQYIQYRLSNLLHVDAFWGQTYSQVLQLEESLMALARHGLS